MSGFRIFLLGLLIFSACDTENNFPSPYENRFVKFYGDDGNHEGVDLLAFDDGTIILVGNEITSNAPLGEQIYVVKVDATGAVLWEKTIGSQGDDVARDIEKTPDGNIIIAGETYKSAGERDVYVKIISTNGDELDSARYSGIFKTETGSEADEEVNSISIISDGYIISGATTAVTTLKSEKPNDTKDALHIKINSSLDLIDSSTGLWKYTSGLNDSEDILVKVFQVSATEYYAFGYTNTIRSGSRDYKFWIFKLGATGESSSGDEDFLDLIGSVNNDEILSSVIESPPQSAEGFVLSGLSKSASGATESFVLKLQKQLFPSDNGFVQLGDKIIVEQSPNQLGNDLDGVTRMISSASGGFYLLSNTNTTPSQSSNILLSKLSNNCELIWESIPFGGLGDDFSASMTELPDGRILVLGTMTLGGVSGQTGQTKMFLMKLDSSGKLLD